MEGKAKMKSLNVMYASSNLYSSITGVSILSMLEKNPQIDKICFYILSYGITEENKERLKKTVKNYNKDIVFIDMEPYVKLVENMGVMSYKSSTMVYMKFFVSHYIPESIERIIHIDSDTYFTGKIDEWLTLDMKGKPCAMNQDCIHKLYKRYIEMREDIPYYNSGLVIFDMAEWKRQSCEQKILEHIKNVRAGYPLVDQDLFNMVLHSDIYEISIKNNLLPPFLLYQYKYYNKIYGIDSSMLSEKEFKEGIENTVMHQFSGNSFGRPWFPGSKHPLAKEYMECWKRSEWKDVVWENRKIPFAYRVQCFLHYHTPKSMNAWCGYWMQQIFMKINYDK